MAFKREILNQWLLAVTLHFVLFQIAGELKAKDALLPDTYCSSDTVVEKSPADRLVFVVIEGLRWDVFFRKGNISSFSLLISTSGTVGPISTPSHDFHGLARMVTGLPGYYGYNYTDSIFNFGRTLYIGPPSVGRLFSGLNDSYCYPAAWENLTISPNETKGDEWVFEKWRQILSPLITNKKNLFFFYLSGLSIASQVDGPTSYRALKEMKFVLDSLEQLYWSTENYFNDSKTAYIVTSDYGFMEDDEEVRYSLNETRVPLITWGAGLATRSQIADEDSSRLNRRSFVSHEDLTPLMSYLSGTAIPCNSYGVAPIIRLSSNNYRAKLLFLNARQLTKLFLSFEKAYGFGLASICAPLNKNDIVESLSEIKRLFLKEEYYSSISKSQDLIKLALEGIRYYRHYETFILWICAVVSLIGWAAVTLGWVIEKVKVTPMIQREMVPDRQENSEQPIVKNLNIFRRFLTPPFLVNMVWFTIFCCMIGILIFISAPLIVSLATILAIGTSWLAVKSSLDWIRLYKSMSVHDIKIKKGKPLMYLAYFLILTCSLSVPIVTQVIFSFAIVFTALSDLRNSTGSHLAYWMLSSNSYLILLHYSINTPYLPVLMIAAMVWIVAGGIFLHSLKVRLMDMPIFLVAFFSIALISIHSQYGPPTTEQNLLLRWTPMLLIFFVLLVGSSSLPVRLFQLFLCLSVPVFLLSLSFEPISLLIIINHVFSWALLEGYSDVFMFFSSSINFSVVSTSINWTDVRRSFYFLAYVLTSFLVIGNSCEIYDWSKEWPSYFGPVSGLNGFLLVCLKSLPVVLIDNIFLTVLEKKSSIGYLSLILHLSSDASLINFILVPESSVTLYNQLMFISSLIMRPVSYLLLAPSMLSALKRKPATPATQERSHEMRQSMTAETFL